MVTDDPGTPGNNRWEINLAWTEQRAPGSTLIGIPQIDANYGVGDRIQLNYMASWNILRETGEPAESGTSDSQVAVKWRFYDAGETGLQISTYPRITFPDPGSDSDPRGIADPHTTFLLPFEVRKDCGIVTANAEIGHAFSSAARDSAWIAGLCVGREVSKGWEIDAEVYATGSDRLEHNEVLVNAGTRYDLSEHATLLLAVGRDTHNSLSPRLSLLAYAGIQIRM
jgi:hypothetical protein